MSAVDNIVVSVCCITYNHERFIRDSLNGFLMQETSFPIEVIIHDDASTDGTADIIREYERRRPDLIKPIYQTENQYSKGIKVSATYVWPRARGRYIALCEGDDYWTDPHKLQKQVDFLEAHPECSMCFHRTYRLVQATGEIEIWQFRHQPRKCSYTLDDIVVGGDYLRTGSIMFRNELIREFPALLCGTPVGDWPLLVVLAQHGDAGFIDQPMSVYRVHNQGVMSGAGVSDLDQMLMSTAEAVRTYLGPEYDKLIRRGISRANLTLAAVSADRGNLVDARSYFWKSITGCPFNPDLRIRDRLVLLGRLYAPSVYTASKRLWASLGHARRHSERTKRK